MTETTSHMIAAAQACLDGEDFGMSVSDLVEDMMHEIVRLQRENACMELKPAELATICCALGHWQGSSASAPRWVHHLGYGHRPLTVPEIEALAKRLLPDTPDEPYEEGASDNGLSDALNYFHSLRT